MIRNYSKANLILKNKTINIIIEQLTFEQSKMLFNF